MKGRGGLDQQKETPAEEWYLCYLISATGVRGTVKCLLRNMELLSGYRKKTNPDHQHNWGSG